MATESEVITRLRAITDDYDKKMGDSAKAVEGVGDATEKTDKHSSKLRKTLGNLATGFAVYKGAQYIKGAVKNTTDLAKATAGLQRLTGMDTQTAAGWVTVSKQRGVQAKQLNQGFISLSKQITGATAASKTQQDKLAGLNEKAKAVGVSIDQMGGKGKKAQVKLAKLHATAKKLDGQIVKVATTTKGAQQAFEELGVSSDELAKLTPQQVMGKLADAFKKLPSGANKAALAQKLFGRQAQMMLPLLNQGSVALNKQIATMGKSSGMTDKSKKSALDLAKSQREMQASMMALQGAVGVALIPTLSTLQQIITPIAVAFSKLMQSSEAFRIAVIVLTAALVTWIAVGKLVALTGLAVNASWLLIPTVIVAIVVALVLLYKKCAWFRAFVDQMAAGVVVAFNAIKAVVTAVAGQMVGEFNRIKGAITAMIAVVKTISGAVSRAFRSALNAAKSIASGFADIGKSIVQAIVSGITSAPGAILSAIKSILPGGKAGKIIAKAIPGFAAGGMMMHPGLAVVGERGPELVALPGGARVMPTQMTAPAPALAGGGPMTANLFLDRRLVAQAVAQRDSDVRARR